VLYNCVGVPYERPTEILPGVELRFVEAGHILGAAMVALQIDHAGRGWTLTFTGDLGRRAVCRSRSAPIPLADVVICESTYGARTHEPLEQMARTMSEVVRRTVGRGGKVLIRPSASAARSSSSTICSSGRADCCRGCRSTWMARSLRAGRGPPPPP
jgi:metallo-beta-lactamase family protein